MNRFAVTTTEPPLQQAVQHLASQYHLPTIPITKQENFDFILLLTPQGLSLQNPKKRGWGNLQVDFLKGKIGYRLSHIQNQKQLLAKAIGSKKHLKTNTILDLTAGLGNDGFILAQLGFSVTLLERSPIIAALLADGLSRALRHEKYSTTHIQLIHRDAILYLQQLIQTQNFPDVIYLDPMYPHSRKSALAKKEMCLLRQIVGDDSDAETLLPLAITCAQQRIIVKRPRLASALAGRKPQYSIVGKQHRFDIYLATRY